MLRIWGRRNAYNVQKVLWTIGELGLPYEHANVGSTVGELETPEFLAMNPHGRIPVIVDGETVVWESNTIVRYLVAVYGANSLWMTHPADRSLAERWMDWELATLQPAFLALFWGFFRMPAEQRDHVGIDMARSVCEKQYQKLDAHLENQPYLAGAAFTMADISCATSLYRYHEMGVPLPRRPSLMAWYRRLAERPAFREHIMVPFEELRGRLAF